MIAHMIKSTCRAGVSGQQPTAKCSQVIIILVTIIDQAIITGAFQMRFSGPFVGFLKNMIPWML